MFETSEYLYLLTKGCLVFCIETCIWSVSTSRNLNYGIKLRLIFLVVILY